MNRLPMLAALLCVLVSNSFEQTGGSEVLVLSAGQGWQIAGKKIERDHKVPAGAAVTSTGPDSGALLLDCGAGGWLSYACTASGCRVAACSTEAEGVTVRRVDLASQLAAPASRSHSLLKYEPKEAVVTGVRAPGNPNEAVLLVNAGAVHFAPALTRVLEGQYCLRLTRLPAQPGNPPQTVRINWDRSVDPEGAVAAPTLSSGLYSLEKGTPADPGGCEVPSDAVASWVLIVPEAQFPSYSADWKNVTSQAHDLSNSGLDREALLAARHAVLASMADSLQTK
jgi:hypothetical protein